MENINNKMAKGAAWMVIFKLAGRSIAIVSTMILARLLIPGDFGLIAMAMSVIAILELMSAFGFDMALIQNQNANDSHYNTAWTYNVIFGLVSAVILILIASPIASFYNESRLENIVYVLAVGAAIQGFENVGVVEFRKEMQFRKEFYFLVAKKIIGFLIVIPCAYFIRNYWALVAGIVGLKFGSVILSYLVHSYKPKFSLSASHDLFNFSKWLLLTHIFSFLKTRSSDFVIGRELGAKSLGLYTISNEISEMPSTEIVMPINRAIFPGFAKLSHNIKYLRESFIKVLSVIAIFAIPAGVGLASTAEYVVLIMLGNKWIEAISLIEIIAYAGSITALQTNIPYVYFALNKPKITTFINIAYVLTLIPMLIIFTDLYGLKGAAYSYLLTTATILPLNLYILSKYINTTIFHYISALWRPVFAALLMYISINLLNSLLITSGFVSIKIVTLLLLTSFGAIIYFIALGALWYLSGKPLSSEVDIYLKVKIYLQNRFFTSGS